MNKENFIDSKIKELPYKTLICVDSDDVHIQISTKKDKVIKTFELFVIRLKAIQARLMHLLIHMKWRQQ